MTLKEDSDQPTTEALALVDKLFNEISDAKLSDKHRLGVAATLFSVSVMTYADLKGEDVAMRFLMVIIGIVETQGFQEECAEAEKLGLVLRAILEAGTCTRKLDS